MIFDPYAKPLPAYRDLTFDNLERYWTDADHRARIDAETAHQLALTHSNMDAALIASGNRWPAHWTDAEKADATRKDRM
jgi:hypothetical protein